MDSVNARSKGPPPPPLLKKKNSCPVTSRPRARHPRLVWGPPMRADRAELILTDDRATRNLTGRRTNRGKASQKNSLGCRNSCVMPC